MTSDTALPVELDALALDLTKRIEREFYYDQPGGAAQTRSKVRSILSDALRALSATRTAVKPLETEGNPFDAVRFVAVKATGEHSPSYILADQGGNTGPLIEINHHLDCHIDDKRAEWMASALNAACFSGRLGRIDTKAGPVWGDTSGLTNEEIQTWIDELVSLPCQMALRELVARRNGAATRVNALEWREINGDGFVREEADCILGLYRISKSAITGKWRWLLNALDGPWSLELATLDEAKAAAQADYERRILSALSDAPVVKEITEEMVGRRGIYLASKVKHAGKWKALRSEGVPVISTWIDEAGAGESVDLADLWQRCIHEASHAGALILYREPDEVLKGAWVELGAALASGVPVFAVGIREFTVAHDARIQHFDTLDAALTAAFASRPSQGGEWVMAEAIIDHYYDMLPSDVALPARCEPEPGTTWAHIKWMLNQMSTMRDQPKAMRWLGFIQGVLIERGYTTVTRERDFTRPFFSASPSPLTRTK